jgi:hypothetical protein
MKERNRIRRPQAGDAIEDMDPEKIQAVRRAFRDKIHPEQRLYRM